MVSLRAAPFFLRGSCCLSMLSGLSIGFLMPKGEEEHMDESNPIKTDDPWARLREEALTSEDVEGFEEPLWLIPNLIASGHTLVLVGKPGIGKSVIARDSARKLAEAGYDVMYINMDCTRADAKSQFAESEAAGYELLAPHTKESGIAGIWQSLVEIANTEGDLSGSVVFFDTLKKIPDLMSKSSVKEFFKLTRTLTGKGATVVLLAHTNKHPTNGKIVFEGVGDVESDCDDLVYLVGSTDGDIQTIQTEPSDKVRGIFRAITWEYNRTTRGLELVPNRDLKSEQIVAEQVADDLPFIGHIKFELIVRNMLQKDLVDLLKNEGIGRNRALALLQRYSSAEDGFPQHWIKDRLQHKNACIYRLAGEGGGLNR